MPVGESLDPCTKEVNSAIIDLNDAFQCKNGRLVVVDTPGFDAPDKSDAQVLQQIVEWLRLA